MTVFSDELCNCTHVEEDGAGYLFCVDCGRKWGEPDREQELDTIIDSDEE